MSGLHWAVTFKESSQLIPTCLMRRNAHNARRDNDDVLEQVFDDFPQSTAQNSFNHSSDDSRPTIIRRPFNLLSNRSSISKCRQEADDRIGQYRHGFV